MRWSLMCLAAVLGLVMLVGCQQPKAEPEPGQEAAMATPEPVPAEPPPPLAKQTHVVAKGDTLFSLARQYYNDQGKWKVILEANKEKIPNKDKLKIGTELIIP